MLLLTLAGAVLLLDQGIKDVIERAEDQAFPKEIEETGGMAVLCRSHNPGLPMGALARYPRLVRWVPVIVTSAAAAVFAWMYPRKGYGTRKLGLALVLGGSASNLYDRFVRGYVVDYLNVRLKGLRKIIFNIGDVCILLGSAVYAGGELLSGLRGK